MTKIKWVIDGHRYWDKTNGNSYYLTRATHVGTGKSIIFDECEGNVRAMLATADKTHYPRVHVSPIAEMSYRDWRRMLNSEYYAPTNPYVRKGNKLVNISTQLIRKLARST